MHSRLPNRGSMKECAGTGNVGSGGSKTMHHDFSGVPNLSPRAEDYREIFGSFSSRASSIPVLVLPELDEADLYFDVRSSGFCYSELFGDFDAADFAPSYEDLFRPSVGAEAADSSSSEEARTPAEAESLPEESDHCFSIEDPYQSFEASTDFSTSYHKCGQSMEEDLPNGSSHIAQAQTVPECSFAADQTAPRPSLSLDDKCDHNKECNVMSEPFCGSDGKGKFDSHFVPQRGYGSHYKGFVTISDISLQTEPSHLPPPSRPPPLVDARGSTSNCKSMDSAGTGCDSSSFLDVEVDASSSAIAMKEVRKAPEKMTSVKQSSRRSVEKRCGRPSFSSVKYDYFVEVEPKIEDKQAKEIEENRQKMKEVGKRRESEKKPKELYKSEVKGREVIDHESIANWVKEALQQEENEMKLKEDREREGNERRQRKAREREDDEKRLRETREREANEKKLREAEEENERRQRIACEREEIENRLKETREEEENVQRLKEACEKEKSERRLKKELERNQNEKRLKETRKREENERRLKESFEREENEKRLKESREREENERRLKELCEREGNERRLKEFSEREENDERLREARKREENQKKVKEDCEREENVKRKIEAHEKEQNEKRWRGAFEKQTKMLKKQKDAKERNDSEKTFSEACEKEEIAKRVEELWQQESNSKSLGNGLEREESETRLEAFMQKETKKAPKEATRWKETERLHKDTSEIKDLKGLNKVYKQTEMDEKLELLNSTNKGHVFKDHGSVRGAPESSDKKSKAVEMESVVVDERNNTSSVKWRRGSEQKVENLRVENDVELHLLEGNLKKVGEDGIGGGQKCTNRSRKKWVANGGKIDVVLEIRANTQYPDKQEHTKQRTVSKDTNLSKTCVLEVKETERERELDQQRLQKIEEMEREREREKDRMAVDKAILEARESAHEKAEEAAVERLSAQAQQKTLSEARERLEKACAEAREMSLPDKASMEARLRMERTAVQRATTEARERIERSVSENFSGISRIGRMRQSSSSSDLQDLNSQSSGSFDGSRNLNSSVSVASCDAERSEVAEDESAHRCRARLERHQRMEERAAKALEEKNMRDLLAIREQEERNRLSETLDAEVKRWSSGKHGNLRALLSTLQYILGPGSGWQPIPLTEVITNAAVKKAYRKATLCIHPDKLQQRGANIQQKYICEKVFDLLKEAWNKFNSEER